MANDPLAYLGVNKDSNPPVIVRTAAPSTSDTSVPLGTVWVNRSGNTAYILTSVVAGSASWALSSPGASDVDSLTGDAGGAISPAAGNINLLGGTNIASSGAGSTITFNLDAAISLATSVTSPIYTAAALADLNINSAAGQDVIIQMGDAAAANKVSFEDNASAEVASIDSNGIATFVGIDGILGGVTPAAATVTTGTASTSFISPIYTVAALADLNIRSVAGQDIIIRMGDAAAANKVSFHDSANVEVAAIDSNGGLTTTALTFTGLLTANASATLNTAGAALNLGTDNAAGAVNIGHGTTIRAINIGTVGAVAHTVSVGSAAAGAIAVDTAAGISLDAATASNFTVTGAADLTLASTLGSIIVNAEEAVANAIQLQSAAGGIDWNSALQSNIDSSQAAATAVRIVASNAGGGIDIDAGTTGIAIDSTGAVSIQGGAASDFSVGGAGIDLSLVSAAGRVVVNGEEAAADAVRVLSVAGGLDCDVALQLSLVSSQAAVADSIVIDASAADGGIDIDAGSGGINAASGGVFDIDAVGALSLNSSTAAINIGNDAIAQAVNLGTGAAARTVTVGSTTTTSALVLQSGSGEITVTGTVKEIDAEFLYASGTDIVVSQSPILQSNATTGAAPSGATGDVNLMYLQDGCLMEQFILGAAQTIIAPRMTVNGLDLALDQTASEGAEYNFGARANSKHSYTIGTSAAFFMEAQIYVEDISGAAPLFIGFRKQEANNATFANYTDYYGIGLNAATSATNIVLASELNAGGQTLQNSTDAWGGDGATKTLRVLVSAAGVVTATIDGAAPSAPLAFTFDNADVVMPYIHFLHGADVAGVVGLKSLKIGFQA